jgi:PAS domain S-box-containing protein
MGPVPPDIPAAPADPLRPNPSAGSTVPPVLSGDLAARHLAAIVASSDDAIVSKDLDGVVTSWNRAAERLFGHSAAEMIGRSIRRIIPADRQHEEDATLDLIRNGQVVDHFETWRVRKDGSLVPISLTVSPIRDAHGQVVGASKIARDITERLRADEERAALLDITRDQAAVTEKLNRVGKVLTAALDPETVVQAVTDAAAEFMAAEYAAFFFAGPTPGPSGYVRYTLPGAAAETILHAADPRIATLFPSPFRGEQVLWLDDIRTDPRYERAEPFLGLPEGHPPVRSYLAVPVMSRSDDVIGGLFLGHTQPGLFTESHRRLATGIALWASIALENARLYARAEQESRLKDEFLATLSHELRTPLNTIVGYIRLMRRGLIAPDRIQQALDTLDRNAVAFIGTVEDILDVSGIINGKVRLNVQPVDLPVVVTEALEAVRPAAAARGVRLDTVLDPHTGSVSGDPERLRQIVWNLLSNAVKFTPRGGRVEIRVEPADSSATVVVSDTGVGIEPEFLPHVFERFRQGDAGIVREAGGLGLGLAIVRHLVELHGGTVGVVSAGRGRGATFKARFPSIDSPVRLEAVRKRR